MFLFFNFKKKEFFARGEENSCQIVDDETGVLFVHYPDGRATGDAFVMFKNDEDASKSLLKHKETMGPRYIELFRSTPAEVQQVLKRSQDPKFYHGLSQASSKEIHNCQQQGGGGGFPLPVLPPEMLSGCNKRDCIRLRNLPLNCGVEQILEFLGVHSQHIVHQGVHMILNAQGKYFLKRSCCCSNHHNLIENFFKAYLRVNVLYNAMVNSQP